MRPDFLLAGTSILWFLHVCLFVCLYVCDTRFEIPNGISMGLTRSFRARTLFDVLTIPCPNNLATKIPTPFHTHTHIL